MRIIVGLLPVLLCTLAVQAWAQYARPEPSATVYRLPRLTHNPPITKEMPRVVRIGYLYLDSLARSTGQDPLDKRIKRLSFSDTLKRTLSYLYQMCDYDPLRYYQFGITAPSSGIYKSSPDYFKVAFGNKLCSTYPDSGTASHLYSSDYILDVQVVDTASTLDPISAISKRIVTVTAFILDTIKGRMLPKYHIAKCSNRKEASLSQGHPFTQFEYRPMRIRVRPHQFGNQRDSLTFRPDGSDWVKAGERYIVFLQLHNLYHNDPQNDYVDLEPLYLYSTCASMYPVINGIVYNPHNDLGIGTSLTPENFKAALRQKIFTIVAAK